MLDASLKLGFQNPSRDSMLISMDEVLTQKTIEKVHAESVSRMAAEQLEYTEIEKRLNSQKSMAASCSQYSLFQVTQPPQNKSHGVIHYDKPFISGAITKKIQPLFSEQHLKTGSNSVCKINYISQEDMRQSYESPMSKKAKVDTNHLTSDIEGEIDIDEHQEECGAVDGSVDSLPFNQEDLGDASMSPGVGDRSDDDDDDDDDGGGGGGGDGDGDGDGDEDNLLDDNNTTELVSASVLENIIDCSLTTGYVTVPAAKGYNSNNSAIKSSLAASIKSAVQVFQYKRIKCSMELHADIMELLKNDHRFKSQSMTSISWSDLLNQSFKEYHLFLLNNAVFTRAGQTVEYAVWQNTLSLSCTQEEKNKQRAFIKTINNECIASITEVRRILNAVYRQFTGTPAVDGFDCLVVSSELTQQLDDVLNQYSCCPEKRQEALHGLQIATDPLTAPKLYNAGSSQYNASVRCY